MFNGCLTEGNKEGRKEGRKRREGISSTSVESWSLVH